MTQIVWSPQSLRDIEAIRAYIAEDSPRYADLMAGCRAVHASRLSVCVAGALEPSFDGRRSIRFRGVYRGLPSSRSSISTASAGCAGVSGHPEHFRSIEGRVFFGQRVRIRRRAARRLRDDFCASRPGRLQRRLRLASRLHARAIASVANERGWPAATRAGFDAQRGPQGALLIGSPDEVVEKVVRHSEALGGISRITFQMNAASLPHAMLVRAIEAVGTRVAPALRDISIADKAI